MSLPEAKIERDLYYLLRTVLEKHNYTLNGVELGDIQPQHSVDGGIADLVLPFANGKHFLVIECKRKISKPSGLQALRDFDVYGSKVINQAMNYADRLGAHVFATTNGARFALFRRPKAGEPFRIDTHRLLVQDPFKLLENNVKDILDFLTRWHVNPSAVDLVQIDWFFISRLRSFVDFLSKPLIRVISKMASSKTFLKNLEELSEISGVINYQQLARQTAYLLMNKIVFYKILERHYDKLPELQPLAVPDGKYFTKLLKGYFEKAIEVTGDFEPIFITKFYDQIPLPDLDYVFEEVNSFVEEMSNYKLEKVGSDVVGYIYEELIPEEERHKLGQFYTPPPIAELIAKWAVRNHDDKVFDPAVGSGTFLVKTYGRLRELKSEHYEKLSEKRSSVSIHEEIISQIYADDLNPFPAHLTSMNLAMRDVRYPTSEMNIIVEDFFNLRSRMKVFSPYVLKTTKGERKRQFTIPLFDVIVANPPYTRWVEIPDRTKNSINRSIGELLKKYMLSGGIGKETGIYIHFIMHAYSFLKDHGRLGMIISNNWLQTDYGRNFTKFLLDHFKIKAIIDFNQRLFRLPLIATCLILLEKEKNKKARNENLSTFMYIEEETKVEEIRESLKNPEKWKEKFQINTVKQGDIPTDGKIIKTMFSVNHIEETVKHSPLIRELGDFFDTDYGNVQGVFARGGTGGDKFFYLTKEEAEHRGLIPNYAYPALISSRYVKTFQFTKSDWKKLRDKGRSSFIFISHKPKKELPKNIQEYIDWGEKEPLIKVRERDAYKTARETIASAMREKSKNFFGWYDLGGITKTPLFTSRRAQYRHRFVIMDAEKCSLDDGFITLKPTQKLTKEELIAECAYLNSDISNLFVELYGRSTGGGLIELDAKTTGRLPILDLKKLTQNQIVELNLLFKELEDETRRIGGSETQEHLEKLHFIYEKINSKIAEILDLDKEFVEKIKQVRRILSDRRIARIMMAKPESIKGEEKPKIVPPLKKKRKKLDEMNRPLTRWIKQENGESKGNL